MTNTLLSFIHFGIWWDGDLLRELLDHTSSSAGKIDK
ncbi:hypothetical protein [Paenibacillus sp. NPDC055715]